MSKGGSMLAMRSEARLGMAFWEERFYPKNDGKPLEAFVEIRKEYDLVDVLKVTSTELWCIFCF